MAEPDGGGIRGRVTEHSRAPDDQPGGDRLRGVWTGSFDRRWSGLSLAVLLLGVASAGVRAQAPEDLDVVSATMRPWVERWTADRDALERRYDAPMSARRRARLAAFHAEWQRRLEAVNFAALDRDAQVDAVLLHSALLRAQRELEFEARRDAEVAPLLPFAPTVVALAEERADVVPVAAETAAATVDGLARAVKELRAAHQEEWRKEAPVAPAVARRAAQRLSALRRALRAWFAFRDGYDPQFSWWVKSPYDAADKALDDYESWVRRELVGAGNGDDEPLVGDPIGRDALIEQLGFEFITYTPEELIAIAERELEWCRGELKKASNEMGCGDDWKAALDRVKSDHVAPGDQPALIRKLSDEAVAFIEKRDLVTIPPLAKEVWRMQMMSPDRQKVTPYFTGGEVVSVSYPTAGMDQADKVMSLRGNNEHFSRAVVFHELIPGHHLQQFMTGRYREYRRAFRTPFWVEGGALYWELRMWDLGFARSPEDRIGMLFWRAHRCARIVFSLKFQLGEWSADQAVDYLVNTIGHERRNATAEVRRSINGSYAPLYQCAYMLGGMQLRALREELVGGGKLTDRQFDDAVLRHGPIPIDLLRANLRPDLPLTLDHRADWRFAD